MYKKLYKEKTLDKINDSIKLKGVNDSLINVCGKSYDKIKLKGLSDWFDLEFLVVEDNEI